MPFALKPHQRTALKKMHDGCILAGAVGSGKSFTALAYYYNRVVEGVFPDNVPLEPPKKKVDLYVITTPRKRDEKDWQDDATLLAMTSDREHSFGGNIITVDSWNNLSRYVGVKDAFFIFDEQRVVGSGAWVKAFLKIAKYNRWILLSGTPGDTWMDYIPVFVANGFYRNRSHFIDEHVVYDPYSRYPKVKRYIGQKHLDVLRGRLLVEMPVERHTVRHIHQIRVSHDAQVYDDSMKRRWNPFTEAPMRDASEKFAVARKITNTHESRFEAILALQKKHPRLIVFYNFDYELEILRDLVFHVDCEVAEWNGHKHEPVPEGESWIYLVQYTSGAEAWNCTTTDALAMYSLNYSYRITEQVMGRIDRLNTKYVDLHYYILRSGSSIDLGVWRALQAKKNFNESAFQL